MQQYSAYQPRLIQMQNGQIIDLDQLSFFSSVGKGLGNAAKGAASGVKIAGGAVGKGVKIAAPKVLHGGIEAGKWAV